MLDLARSRWTIVEAVKQQADRYGDREFAQFEEGGGLSFAALDTESTAIAFGLARLGVRSGDRVLALIQNRVEFLPALVGTNKLNATFVTINTGLKGSFLEHQVRNSEPQIALVDAELLPAFDGIELHALGVTSVVIVGGGTSRPPEIGGVPTMGFTDLPVSVGDPGVLVEPQPHDISTVMYTSGTTGPSKGVLMPHAHCYLLGYNLAATMGLTEADVYYVCMPLFHANGLFMQTFGSFLCGARVSVVKRFSASRWLEDVRTCGATVTNGLGVMPEFIFRQPPTPHDRAHNLRAMMAVPIAAEWGGQFEERFGMRLVQGFGLTETNIVCYSRPDEPLTPGCAGSVLTEWFDVAVVDPDTDEALPVGEVGEIVVRAKRPWCIMAGYLHMPERTVEAWRNLWFHTGDAGYFDAQGRLFFVDRIKDCIRRRGENISSYEVEQVINEHPAVAESAVIAVKSSIPGGEDEVKACVVMRAGHSLQPESLLDYCQKRMPYFAVPRYVEYVDELPKTPTGKVQKEPLRKQGASSQTWDREAVGYRVRR
jgi:crotonobetaine/carnitine-CoA ligase